MSEKKESKNALTIPVRISFPDLFVPVVPKEFLNQAPKYMVNLLFPKADALLPGAPSLYPPTPDIVDLMGVRKLLHCACVCAWGPDKSKWPLNIRNLSMGDYVAPAGTLGWPIREGVGEQAGFNWIRVKSGAKYRPPIMNAKNGPVINPEEVFGGLICRASVNAFAWAPGLKDGNQDTVAGGVSLGINALQILKDDGTKYSGVGFSDVFGAYDAGGGTTAAPGAASTGSDDDWLK